MCTINVVVNGVPTNILALRRKGLIEEYYSFPPAPDCRFMLKKTGANILYCIGRNPSFGSIYCTDPTLSVVDAIAARNGFDGFAMLNLYPQRGADGITFSKDLIEQHALFVASQIPAGSFILAAWGEIVGNNPDYKDCLTKIVTQFPSISAFTWLNLGMTQSRHPKMPFPMGFKYNDILPNLTNFGIDAYLRNNNIYAYIILEFLKANPNNQYCDNCLSLLCNVPATQVTQICDNCISDKIISQTTLCDNCGTAILTRKIK